jgi:protein-arginine kinase
MKAGDLNTELYALRERLNKAVVFEVNEDVSIGISEVDGLFRIRREEPSGQYSFLNKNYQWEEQATNVDLAYSERTGYHTADEAFDVFETTKKFEQIIHQPSVLKNN